MTMMWSWGWALIAFIALNLGFLAGALWVEFLDFWDDNEEWFEERARWWKMRRPPKP
jgi:hypothetical protein